MNSKVIKAVVAQVFNQRKTIEETVYEVGIAIANSYQLGGGSVMFSLRPEIWIEKQLPESGSIVYLSGHVNAAGGFVVDDCARLWAPSDERLLESVMDSIVPLYPFSREYPFDEVCSDIVCELWKRNYQVPGIEVRFDVYGSGAEKYRMVREIIGEDFQIYFLRKQRTMPNQRLNDIAAVHTISIPKKQINVYEDHSGPTMYLYVGKNYPADKDQFFNGLKVHSKMDKKPCTYLRYSGSRHFSILTADNDLGREYSPNACQPKQFSTSDVFNEFADYLRKKVYEPLAASPIPAESSLLFVEDQAIPVPKNLGPIYCFATYKEGETIEKGMQDIDSLPLLSAFPHLGKYGHRLLALGYSRDSSIPKIANEGFVWCGLGPVNKLMDFHSIKVPGHSTDSDENYLIRINLNRANEVYVADHGAYEKKRSELWRTIGDSRDRLTDAELGEMYCARARTIVPVSEYNGGFSQPVLLINRELGFDEVEIVSGPHMIYTWRKNPHRKRFPSKYRKHVGRKKKKQLKKKAPKADCVVVESILLQIA